MTSTNILLRDSVHGKIRNTVTHFRETIDEAEPYYATIIQAVKTRLQTLYESSVILFENLGNNDTFISIKNSVHIRYDELIRLLRSHRLNAQFHELYLQAKRLVLKDLSRQAVILGFAGLVTGGVIGVCVGYRFRSVANSSPLSSASNGNQYVMRAILSTSTRSGIDGVTLSILPYPTIVNPDEVVVQVKAVGIDSIDARIACGYRQHLRSHLGLSSTSGPWVLGRECSGIVVDVGHQVTGLEISNRVWVLLPLWATNGVMSEFVVVSQNCVVPKPANIGFEAAATMPYAFVTFWREVVKKWNVGPQFAKNRRVLIHLGATSKNDGVGLLATQLFKGWGSRVTISTEENMENEEDLSSGVAQMTFLHSLKTLGAESHLIIPRDCSLLPNLTQRIFDIVINTDSSAITPLLRKFSRDPESKVIETFPTELQNSGNSVRAFLYSTLLFPFSIFFRKVPRDEESPKEILLECKKLVESRVLVPVVAKSFLPSQYDQAFRHVSKTFDSPQAQANVGKCVLVFKSK